MAKTPKNTSASKKSVEALTHEEAKRKNIPTAEYQSALQKAEQDPVRVAYKRGAAGLEEEKTRRNRDLDPQLVWRGKDEQDWSDLVVQAPPLYIQEKVHPKALIDDLLRESREREYETGQLTPDLFADFNGIPKGVDKTEFYQHDQNWSNRMILGDSLQVMASLAEHEGLRGKVQCIYIDPPYGIRFNSNFQWSTTDRSPKDGNAAHITREPEQVKAFRDTWRDGIHSYLTYIRDRLTVACDLLTDSGSIFVQIGDENVHRIRAVLDEVFGENNFVAMITTTKTSGQSDTAMASVADYVLWFSKEASGIKTRKLLTTKNIGGEGASKYTSAQLPSGRRVPLSHAIDDAGELIAGARPFRLGDVTSTRPAGDGDLAKFVFEGRTFTPGKRTFTTDEAGLIHLSCANRLVPSSNSLSYVRFLDDFPAFPQTNVWTDIGGIQSRADPKVYVVQTGPSLLNAAF